jgi:hypothetical protein
MDSQVLTFIIDMGSTEEEQRPINKNKQRKAHRKLGHAKRRLQHAKKRLEEAQSRMAHQAKRRQIIDQETSESSVPDAFYKKRNFRQPISIRPPNYGILTPKSQVFVTPLPNQRKRYGARIESLLPVPSAKSSSSSTPAGKYLLQNKTFLTWGIELFNVQIYGCLVF